MMQTCLRMHTKYRNIIQFKFRICTGFIQTAFILHLFQPMITIIIAITIRSSLIRGLGFATRRDGLLIKSNIIIIAYNDTKDKERIKNLQKTLRTTHIKSKHTYNNNITTTQPKPKRQNQTIAPWVSCSMFQSLMAFTA